MLKYLAGLVLVFGLTVYVSIQDERSTQQTTQKSAQADKGALPAKTDENHPQQNVHHPEWNTPRWYAVLSPLFRWPEGPTTWVIVLTLLAIAEQARETAKATEAMRESMPFQRDAAQAALLNAKAVINAERPWIVIFGINDIKRGACFMAGNMGRTPAEIVSFSAECRCIESIHELPEVPEFSKDTVPQMKILVPGKKLGDQNIELLGVEEFTDFIETCRRESGKRPFPAPAKMSAFYFRVKYTYVGGQPVPDALPYESCTCFGYQPQAAPEPYVCGGENYNRHT
jgi:hypothetical protein